MLSNETFKIGEGDKKQISVLSWMYNDAINEIFSTENKIDDLMRIEKKLI